MTWILLCYRPECDDETASALSGVEVIKTWDHEPSDDEINAAVDDVLARDGAIGAEWSFSATSIPAVGE